MPVNHYANDESYEFRDDYAARYPLMYAAPGTRQIDADGVEWMRIEDDRHCHLHMCAVNLSTGQIFHVTRITKRKDTP